MQKVNNSIFLVMLLATISCSYELFTISEFPIADTQKSTDVSWLEGVYRDDVSKIILQVKGEVKTVSVKVCYASDLPDSNLKEYFGIFLFAIGEGYILSVPLENKKLYALLYLESKAGKFVVKGISKHKVAGYINKALLSGTIEKGKINILGQREVAVITLRGDPEKQINALRSLGIGNLVDTENAGAVFQKTTYPDIVNKCVD